MPAVRHVHVTCRQEPFSPDSKKMLFPLEKKIPMLYIGLVHACELNNKVLPVLNREEVK